MVPLFKRKLMLLGMPCTAPERAASRALSSVYSPISNFLQAKSHLFCPAPQQLPP